MAKNMLLKPIRVRSALLSKVLKAGRIIPLEESTEQETDLSIRLNIYQMEEKTS